MHVDDLEDADPGFAVIQAAEQTLVLFQNKTPHPTPHSANLSVLAHSKPKPHLFSNITQNGIQ